MATYDNRHWLLAHVRNSFIATDDTRMCEIVMLGEDLPQLLKAAARSAPPDFAAGDDYEKEPVTEFDCYPDMDHSDDEDTDPLVKSYDIDMDDIHTYDFGLHRQRSNTAQRLEKMERAQRKAAKIKIIKWEDSVTTLTSQEREQLFTKKELISEKLHNGNKVRKKSVFSDMLEKCLHLPQNQYLEFAMYDGVAQYGLQTKTYKIFMTMLPEDLRNYPITVCVIASAKIRDLIGFICYKYSISHPDIVLLPVSSYGLVLCEDDGEVDTDLPCLDANEPCSKYGFTCLGLIDLKTFVMNQATEFPTCSIPEKGGFHVITLPDESKTNDQSMRSRSATFDTRDNSKNLDKIFEGNKSVIKNGKSVNRTNSTVTFRDPKLTIPFSNLPNRDGNSNSAPASASIDPPATKGSSLAYSPQETEALNRMKEHELAIEAPLYQSYHVQIINKIRANTHVLLGISGDKIEIDPFLNSTNLFWPRMKPVSYSIDCVACCEIIEVKSKRGIFRLVYSRPQGHVTPTQETFPRSSSSNFKSTNMINSFKRFDFECGYSTAKEIVEKINIILELKSSACRREYNAAIEKKLHVRRSFH